MSTEAELLRAILVALGARPEVRLFRNNVGLARDATGRHVRFGLAVGASDLVGIVAPHGRFLALEVKSPKGRVRPEQEAFLEMIRGLGGVGRVVRSVAEAEQALAEARQ